MAACAASVAPRVAVVWSGAVALHAGRSPLPKPAAVGRCPVVAFDGPAPGGGGESPTTPGRHHRRGRWWWAGRGLAPRVCSLRCPYLLHRSGMAHGGVLGRDLAGAGRSPLPKPVAVAVRPCPSVVVVSGGPVRGGGGGSRPLRVGIIGGVAGGWQVEGRRRGAALTGRGFCGVGRARLTTVWSGAVALMPVVARFGRRRRCRSWCSAGRRRGRRSRVELEEGLGHPGLTIDPAAHLALLTLLRQP